MLACWLLIVFIVFLFFSNSEIVAQVYSHSLSVGLSTSPCLNSRLVNFKVVSICVEDIACRDGYSKFIIYEAAIDIGA